MTPEDRFWYRILFKNRIYESYGTAFQDLVSQILEYSDQGFERIAPWGNLGDGGNDGWVKASGTYYQVYGPQPNSDQSVVTAVSKAASDFDKLRSNWPNVRRYFFVYNDRYGGTPGPIALCLDGLRTKHELEETGMLGSFHLEELALDLPLDQLRLIVNGVPPATVVEAVDPQCLRELLTHLAGLDSPMPSFLHEEAPDFNEKIEFNGLAPRIGVMLRHYGYQVAVVDEFLRARGPGLAQAIAAEVKQMFAEVKVLIPDADEDAANIRFTMLINRLTAPAEQASVYSRKAYAEAANLLIAKYFETCDVYENPSSVAAT